MRLSLVCLCAVGAALATGCARNKDEVRVVKLRIDGVHKVSRSDLANGLALKHTPWWNFRKHRVFDELLIDGDRQRILRYYYARGYYNAEVTKSEVVPRKNKRKVEIHFKVDEGPATKLQNVLITGVEDLEPAANKAIEKLQLTLRPSQIFVHQRYLDLKERLIGALKDRGYPWADVDGQVYVDRASNLADVQLTLQPGPLSTIGDIEVVRSRPVERDPNAPAGTFRVGRVLEPSKQVAPELVREVFGVTQGSRFKLEDIELGRGKVTQLGVFSTVNLSYRTDPEHDDVVNIRLRVTDASLHELRLGGGFGIEALRNEVRLQLLYTKRNFFGGLRTFEMRLRPAYVVVPAVWQKIVRHGPAVTSDFVFTQPRLGYLTKLQATVGYDLGVEYAYQYHGPRAQLAMSRLLWRDRVQLGLSYNIQYLDFFATAPQILQDATQAGTMYGYTDPYRLAWLQQDFRVDLRDNVFDPRKGGYFEMIFEEGGPFTGSAFLYEKMKIGLRGYAPLGSRVVLAGRVEFGQLWSQGSEGTPITRRMVLGGGTTHRGFSEGRLSPQLPVTGGPALPIGGDQSVLFSLEARVDLVKLAGSMLAAAAFVDAGDVAAARRDTASGFAQNIDMRLLHTAVGGGLRYRTPIGTVRADVGVRVNRLSESTDGRLNPDPGSRVAFHISLAEAF